MDGAPAESHSTGSQVHPLVRQRMLTRAATYTEGAHHSGPSMARRRSSLLSDDSRYSFRSSSDNLMRPSGKNDKDKLTPPEESSVWYSAPLAFAILPAVGGLLFQNGSAVVTDVLLLILASMLLNWCVRSPWDWYHAAQQIQYIDPDEWQMDDAIPEEDEDEDSVKGQNTDATSTEKPAPSEEPKTAEKDSPRKLNQRQKKARAELDREEILALIACFIGPLLGAYLLHTIRSQLTRPAEGLVSNYNLTIFILAAELRPVSHVIKMKQERMLHLQRHVRPEPSDTVKSADIQEINGRLTELETRILEPAVTSDVETMKISATVRQGIQPQLDALNRAVRRYEKRQAAQAIQIEARFQELDARMRDALSLAAAAARTGQRPGLISVMFTWVANFVTYGLQTSWTIATSPFRTAAALATMVKSWVMRSERLPKKRVNGVSNSYPSVSVSTSKLPWKNGR